MPEVHAIKTVIRCRDFEASREFYSSILKLELIEEWEEAEGRGAIFAMAGGSRTGTLEIYQMTRDDRRYDPAFSAPSMTDKIDVQLRTDSVDEWLAVLKNSWSFSGPEDTPWGQRWIKLRDPDNVLIAIYEDLPVPEAS